MLFLTSGLFLGWSLGANHGGNLFGPAVGSGTIQFGRAAFLCAVMVIVGAVLGGGGTTATLGALGAIDAPGGGFVAAFATAITVGAMAKAGLPVSTSQAIVGAIVAWNLFAGRPAARAPLLSILSSWVAAPVVAGVVAAVGYLLVRAMLGATRLHLLVVDMLTRVCLVGVSAIGALTLGANNIANVMGVFASSCPFREITLGPFTVTPLQQLFALGGVAIASGIVTYSRRVVDTVGRDVLRLSPLAALVVLWAHAFVLFLFSSRGLARLLGTLGLPQVPLVPVSSSQALVGAILGLGLVKGGHELRFRLLGGIVAGWLTAPLLTCLACYVSLFVAQNVFEVRVTASPRHAPYELSVGDQPSPRQGAKGIREEIEAAPTASSRAGSSLVWDPLARRRGEGKTHRREPRWGKARQEGPLWGDDAVGSRALQV